MMNKKHNMPCALSDDDMEQVAGGAPRINTNVNPYNRIVTCSKCGSRMMPSRDAGLSLPGYGSVCKSCYDEANEG